MIFRTVSYTAPSKTSTRSVPLLKLPAMAVVGPAWSSGGGLLGLEAARALRLLGLSARC